MHKRNGVRQRNNPSFFNAIETLARMCGFWQSAHSPTCNGEAGVRVTPVGPGVSASPGNGLLQPIYMEVR
ncbi:hypothetical protein HCH_06171 [Hahella chejuensis KCTC 2396]|uniref:Uncharacterized protein n=1 Tax=Hahella chejuensis (strain KCTC 2396) TaxID=349521 RepID=Q2S958_HAHCH|nr:hypothetical protein HCH_06171 [Hahella chejuensis KCTC 2396]